MDHAGISEIITMHWLNGHTFCFLAAAAAFASAGFGCVPVRIAGNWKSVALCATTRGGAGGGAGASVAGTW